MPLLRAIATVGGWTLISRILGYLRDVLIAANLGAGPVADAFFVAFKFPNFFRRLFAEGAFNVAFVPIFAGKLAGEGRLNAFRFAEDAAGVLFFSLLTLVLAVEVSAPWLLYGLAPGFVGDPVRYAFAVEFLRVTFPYLLFIALTALQGGILNSLGHFAAQAAAPILLNLCMIAALLLYAPLKDGLGWTTAGHALSWGVAIAGLAQFSFLLAACRRAGVSLRLRRPNLSPELRELLKRIVPGAIGAGAIQVNLVVGIIIASLLPTGSIAYLYYAERLAQLPVGVIGAAVGTALLPLLSRQLHRGDNEAGRESLNRAIEFALLLTLPAAFALGVLAAPIVSVLFERGAFGAGDAQTTANVLAAFSLGLPAFVLAKVLAPGFFARGDTATPVKITGISAAANLILALLLMIPFRAVGIALAASASAWLNAALLFGLLARRGFEPDARLKSRCLRIVFASAGMLTVIALMADFLLPRLNGSVLLRAGGLGVLVGSGVIAFAGLAEIFGAARFAELRQAITKTPISKAPARVPAGESGA